MFVDFETVMVVGATLVIFGPTVILNFLEKHNIYR
jgi:hypothetical protein